MFPAKLLQNDPLAWQKLTPVTWSPICGCATQLYTVEAAKSCSEPSLPKLQDVWKGMACLIWGRRCQGGRELVHLSHEASRWTQPQRPGPHASTPSPRLVSQAEGGQA